VLLDRRRERTQLLPFRNALGFAVALLAQIPQALIVEIEVVLSFDEL
jgi:hypothetical protein